MFNGIIFNTGKIKTIKKNKKSIYIGLENTLNLNKNDLGSSVSCNGVCLTVSKIHKNLVFFYISIETLKRSNFKYSKVNQLIIALAPIIKYIISINVRGISLSFIPIKIQIKIQYGSMTLTLDEIN